LIDSDGTGNQHTTKAFQLDAEADAGRESRDADLRSYIPTFFVNSGQHGRDAPAPYYVVHLRLFRTTCRPDPVEYDSSLRALGVFTISYCTPQPSMAPRVEDYAPRLNVTIWTLTGVAALFLGLRLYCKVRRERPIRADDYVLVASWVSDGTASLF
jgi:hypothetical protein